MSASTSPIGAGTWLNPGEKDLFKIVHVVRNIVEGRLNACGTFTLASNATSTVVSDQPTVGPYSVIRWQPISPNASPQMTCMYIASQGYNSFTVGHASNSNIDQTFAYVAIG
jgi:hypothetical protein